MLKLYKIENEYATLMNYNSRCAFLPYHICSCFHFSTYYWILFYDDVYCGDASLLSLACLRAILLYTKKYLFKTIDLVSEFVK